MSAWTNGCERHRGQREDAARDGPRHRRARQGRRPHSIRPGAQSGGGLRTARGRQERTRLETKTPSPLGRTFERRQRGANSTVEKNMSNDDEREQQRADLDRLGLSRSKMFSGWQEDADQQPPAAASNDTQPTEQFEPFKYDRRRAAAALGALATIRPRRSTPRRTSRRTRTTRTTFSTSKMENPSTRRT